MWRDQALSDFRSVYLEQALSQMPRLLSLQDRNSCSPTYGSFQRLYWLDKSIDFPDAMASSRSKRWRWSTLTSFQVTPTSASPRSASGSSPGCE